MVIIAYHKEKKKHNKLLLLLPFAMIFSVMLLAILRISFVFNHDVDAFTISSTLHQERNVQFFHHYASLESRPSRNKLLLNAVAGADIEKPSLVDQEADSKEQATLEKADIPTTTTSSVLNDNSKRGKVNEIDYCIAPADVSLSRAYGTVAASGKIQRNDADGFSSINDGNDMVGLSLTRALNNASNRAVRRILLSHSWPSVDEFNRSLRRVAAMEAAAREEQLRRKMTSTDDRTDAKCPVPRPILNVLTGKSKSEGASTNSKNAATNSSESRIGSDQATSTNSAIQRNRTDEEYVADQIQSFRNTYGTLPGYSYAEDYLQCVLALATSGVESPLVPKVMSDGIYDEAYQRILSILQTVGVEFVTNNNESQATPTFTRQRRIADKLIDQDICLSVLDKIQMRNGITFKSLNTPPANVNPDPMSASIIETFPTVVDDPVAEDTNDTRKQTFPIRFNFWSKKVQVPTEIKNTDVRVAPPNVTIPTNKADSVLVSNGDPTMTQQLNKLSNIVQRVLLFGGDQELLVVAETLTSDLPAFIKRWYPNDVSNPTSEIASSRPGVDYLNCMIQLLRRCYNDGVVTDLDPPIPLPASYANSYERLVASAVELGSGYLKPIPSILQQTGNGGANGNGVVASNKMENNIGLVASIPKPRTAQEELGRFAVLESNFRQAQQLSSPSSPVLYAPYPMDLVGQWEVRDEISGEVIGSSVVTFLENGNVQVPPPVEGLRWRLDPGPTHLDTCTFQVLSTIDRTILQYRGFIDRGARLEARFSKRPIRIRGSVMFQMRDGGSVDYYKDMLPINYRTGTTKFVMTKITK